jgi:hypothetical protein
MRFMRNLPFPEQGDRPPPLWRKGPPYLSGRVQHNLPMNDFYSVLQLQVGISGALDA